MHMSITNIPLRVVVHVQESKIGQTYPSIFIEEKFGESYVNVDCTLGAAFKMREKDFEDWFNDGDPATLQEACKTSGISEKALRGLLQKMRPDLAW